MIAFDCGPRFDSGEINVTTAALEKLPAADIQSALKRHFRGDWGDLDAGDRQRNDETLERGGTLASIYTASNGVKFYILTESDRSATTVLLPEEY